MRLDKFLVEMGIGSRSQVKQLVKKGVVTVNGQTVKSSDIKVDEENDEIKYKGDLLSYVKYRYFVLNKPAGCVSATKDNVHQVLQQEVGKVFLQVLSHAGVFKRDSEGQNAFLRFAASLN